MLFNNDEAAHHLTQTHDQIVNGFEHDYFPGSGGMGKDRGSSIITARKSHNAMFYSGAKLNFGSSELLSSQMTSPAESRSLNSSARDFTAQNTESLVQPIGFNIDDLTGNLIKRLDQDCSLEEQEITLRRS